MLSAELLHTESSSLHSPPLDQDAMLHHGGLLALGHNGMTEMNHASAMLHVNADDFGQGLDVMSPVGGNLSFGMGTPQQRANPIKGRSDCPLMLPPSSSHTPLFLFAWASFRVCMDVVYGACGVRVLMLYSV
jgi:hypothetical protein